jgi:hypothetical protein
LPAGSDPIRWFDTWGLQELSPEARSRIKFGLMSLHANVMESSNEDGSRVRKVSLQKGFELFADEYLAGRLLTKSIMEESIPQMVYDAAVSGGWHTGSPTRNSGCTQQFGHYWVPQQVPAMLRVLFEPQVWRYRARLELPPSSEEPLPSAHHDAIAPPREVGRTLPKLTPRVGRRAASSRCRPQHHPPIRTLHHHSQIRASIQSRDAAKPSPRTHGDSIVLKPRWHGRQEWILRI